jgi:hypothetical protein
MWSCEDVGQSLYENHMLVSFNHLLRFASATSCLYVRVHLFLSAKKEMGRRDVGRQLESVGGMCWPYRRGRTFLIIGLGWSLCHPSCCRHVNHNTCGSMLLLELSHDGIWISLVLLHASSREKGLQTESGMLVSGVVHVSCFQFLLFISWWRHDNKVLSCQQSPCSSNVTWWQLDNIGADSWSASKASTRFQCAVAFDYFWQF